MLDINFIKNNLEQVKFAVANKKVQPKVDLDKLLQIHEKRTDLVRKADELRAERNKLTDEIPKATTETKPNLLIKAGNIKAQIQTIETELESVEGEFAELMQQVPNVVSKDMPVGPNEDANKVISAWGEKPKFEFTIKDHIDLGKELDIIDMDTAAEVSGSRFYYLKGDAVLMQFALIQLVMETLSDSKTLEKIADKTGNNSAKAFVPVLPPVMVKPEIMKKMDRLDPIDDRYVLRNDELVLVGSAEHTLGPMHMNHTFELNQLPARYIGYSTAFRREAGSYGKDTKGILRVHQFDKLEMETYTTVENGGNEQKFILAIQEYLVQKLGIPYQVVHICTGDTGKPDYDQFDIECWIPTQDKYRETHTSDYMTDFQSRRLNIKYVDKDGEKQFVHMNDATAFAITRILIAIIENFQQADGSIKIPEALQKYMGKAVISKN